MNPVWIITGKEVRQPAQPLGSCRRTFACRIGTVIRLSRQLAYRFGQG